MQMILNNACDYYEHLCTCIVVLLLNHTHQSKFNKLFNDPCIHKIAISMNVSDMIAIDIKQWIWVL